MAVAIGSIDADPVDHFVPVAGDDVEVIEDHRGVGTLRCQFIDVGATHVYGDRFDGRASIAEKLEERSD